MDPTQQRIKIDLKDSEQIVCKECGNKTFKQVVFLHKLSALLSPYGQDSIIPVAVFQCTKCGALPEETLPQLDE
jgi:uncharacterized Zn finger protein